MLLNSLRLNKSSLVVSPSHTSPRTVDWTVKPTSVQLGKCPDNIYKKVEGSGKVLGNGEKIPTATPLTRAQQGKHTQQTLEVLCTDEKATAPRCLEHSRDSTSRVANMYPLKNGGVGLAEIRHQKRKHTVPTSRLPRGNMDRHTRDMVFRLEDLCLQIHPCNTPPRSTIRSLCETKAMNTNDSDYKELRIIAEAVRELSLRLLPDDPLSIDEVHQLWEEATAAERSLLTLEKATEAAEGFQFPSDIAYSDMKKFESVGWDFNALARLRISELACDRINETAIRAHIDPADPDFDNLISISQGVRVVTAPDFVPNKIPPPLRQKYVSLQSPLNKSIYKNYTSGKTIILPRDALVHILDPHFSLVHCNLEPNKLRVITDSSNAPEGTHPLNSEYVKALARLMWGLIDPVTIEALVIKLDIFMEEHVGMPFEVFKMDMANAFSLFTMHADDVHLLGFLLTDDLIQFEITGSFGKTDYPYVFNVFTNVVRREGARRIIQAIIDMYVDDVMGISIAGERLTENLRILKEFVENVWGKGSISDSKTLRDERRLDMLGYEVDIIEKTVRMSQSNRYKTIRVLSRVKEEIGISILDIMRIASYATRYTKICLVMAPFTCHIYNALTWRRNLQRQLKYIVPGDRLSIECKRAIQLWRCIITFMELRRDDKRFFRTFASFRPQPHSRFQIEFDASLEGAGVIISKFDGFSWIIQRVIRIRYPYDLTSFTFKSSIQNTCEFIAATIGVVAAIKLGAHDGSIRLIGDSETALRWAETWKFRSGPSNSAAVLYVALGLKYNIRLDDTMFVPGVDNVVCDKLSRDTHPSSLGFEASLYSDDEDEDMTRLIALCTPTNKATPAHDFVTQWVEAASFADSLESPFKL